MNYYESIPSVLSAIDHSIEYKGMNEQQAKEILNSARERGKSPAMKRHIMRAQAKKHSEQIKNIFKNANF